MASTSYFDQTRPGLMRRISDGFVNGLAAYMERCARTDQVVALNAKSDEELAARGIRREDIVRYVYRDRFFI